MSDIWNQLLPRFEYFSKPFPADAIALANEHREEVAPYLVASLEAIAANPTPARDGEYMLHLYAMHILATWRDQRAYRPLAQIGRNAEDIVDELMGEVVHETYGRALASTCDGDLAPIRELIEDPAASIWARAAALEGLSVLALEGGADRNVVIDYLASLGEREAARLRTDRPDTVELLDWIVSAATDVGAISLLPAIRSWFADDFLDESIADEAWVAQHIALSTAECLTQLRRKKNSYITDVAEEMAWWSSFSDEDRTHRNFLLDSSDRAPDTYIREGPKVGRNDPCPCGSGRKYKKCHGAVA
jgi:hypothetical protein